jgi:hypothetical protein
VSRSPHAHSAAPQDLATVGAARDILPEEHAYDDAPPPAPLSEEWIMQLIDLLWLSVPAYVIAQAVALLRTSGPWRVAAALPLAVMLPVFAHAAVAFAQQSNLWPLGMLLASPVALLYAAAVATFAPSDGDSAPTA